VWLVVCWLQIGLRSLRCLFWLKWIYGQLELIFCLLLLLALPRLSLSGLFCLPSLSFLGTSVRVLVDVERLIICIFFFLPYSLFFWLFFNLRVVSFRDLQFKLIGDCWLSDLELLRRL